MCTPVEKNAIMKEVEILQEIDHPNILKIYEYFEDHQRLYIVMENLLGGELFEKIIKNEFFNEKEARKIMKNCLEATSYLHNQNIVH